MITVACPECGEAERLAGARAGNVISMSCDACGHRWERDTTRRCKHCDSQDLRYTPTPLWERGRGDQKTPAGWFESYACNTCGQRDVTSSA